MENIEESGLELEVVSGPHEGLRIRLRPGQNLILGRSSRADVVLAGDGRLSRRHLALAGEADGLTVQDLNSTNGTFLNGTRVMRARLSEGDRLRVGASTLVVASARERMASAVDGEPTGGRREPTNQYTVGSDALFDPASDRRSAPRVPYDPFALLRAQRQPLYAVLDPGQDAALGQWLSQPPVRGLARVMAPHGPSAGQGQGDAGPRPCLLPLDGNPALLEALVRQGWGHSWGVYAAAAADPAQVAEHLVRLAWIHAHGRTEPFPFYRPAFLRERLQHWSPEQMDRLLGPLDALLLEGEAEDRIVWCARVHGTVSLRTYRVAVASAPE